MKKYTRKYSKNKTRKLQKIHKQRRNKSIKLGGKYDLNTLKSQAYYTTFGLPTTIKANWNQYKNEKRKNEIIEKEKAEKIARIDEFNRKKEMEELENRLDNNSKMTGRLSPEYFNQRNNRNFDNEIIEQDTQLGSGRKRKRTRYSKKMK